MTDARIRSSAEEPPIDRIVRGMVDALTDAEKVALTAGADTWTTIPIPRLGIPAIRLGDGPHGVRRPRDDAQLSMFDSHPATCFPTAVTLGSTWDVDLVREVGGALGIEAREHGVAVLLGPGVNLKRTPVGGRCFEYFSEDPLVSGLLGAAWTAGVQSTGVGVSVKHFAANNTERRRYGVDSVVDERALRELYLACFEPIVRGAAGPPPATVMAAYNLLGGVHCTENHALLTGILRDEWGFEGVVVSDWGATWDRAISIPAGADLAMPGLGRGDDTDVLDDLASGALPRADLDRAVSRILSLVLTSADHARESHAEPSPIGGRQADAHHALARRAAAAGTVLLQNDGVLPLRGGGRGMRVALIGAMADDPRYQGAGSSHVTPTRLDTLRTALTATLDEDDVTYAAGYERLGGAWSTRSAALIDEAVAVAAEADVAIVVVGLPETFETEGVDRRHLRLPHAHDLLVEAVAAANPSTVVVLQNGSPVETPWRGSVSAIVEAYLGGQAGGSALADVLTGAAEPGGRLAETFPVTYDDHPVSRLPNGPATIEYRESLYVGYRWFDSASAEVAFPFGHGLSYTSLEWSDARVTASADGTAVVEVTVANVGARAGSDVVQVYVHAGSGEVFAPEQELRGFEKVVLGAGESRRVMIELDQRAFEHWDTTKHDWRRTPGAFEIRLGRSSRDIVWRTIHRLDPADAASAPSAALASAARIPDSYRKPSAQSRFTSGDFAALLGRPLPPNRAPWPGEYTLDSAVLDMQDTLVGRALLWVLVSQATRAFGIPAFGRESRAVAREVAAQLTIRLLRAGSGGRLSRRLALRALALLNVLARPRRERRPPARRARR